MDDEPFYEQVAAEVASGDVKPGLWAKAFAEAGGNDPAAKATYIRLRAGPLIAEAKQSAANARREDHAAKRPQREGRLLRLFVGAVFFFIAVIFALTIFSGGFAAVVGTVLAFAFGSSG